jgi:hypothetical protein
MDSSDDSKKNFVKHVFNFDDDSKADIFNIVQYSMIAIIPVILLNKTMAKYVPEADETKGSLEISAEIIVQIIVMFLGLLITHRIITFVPTYSGVKYPEFNIVFIILAVLMITLSLQTKLGEKVSVLFDRLIGLWEGKSEKTQNKQSGVKVSQPISGQSNFIPPPPPAMTKYNDSTSISSLPTNETTNYDAMYRQDTTPLVNAMSPSEPAAANESFGGFSSW